MQPPLLIGKNPEVSGIYPSPGSQVSLLSADSLDPGGKSIARTWNMVAPITATGLSGLKNAGEKIAKTAERIANPSDSSDLAADFVELKSESHAFKASAKLIKIGEELEDTVLDIIA